MPSRQRRSKLDTPKRKPATTPEGRENEMIALAIDCAETQMREGIASSQVITHYLKLGSSRELLEQKRLEFENELTQAKIEATKAAARSDELYAKAIRAMGIYSGQTDLEDDEPGD